MEQEKELHKSLDHLTEEEIAYIRSFEYEWGLLLRLAEEFDTFPAVIAKIRSED